MRVDKKPWLSIERNRRIVGVPHLPRQINLRQIDQLRRAAVEDGGHHEHPELIGLAERRLRRHREFLPGADDIEQDRAVVGKRGLDRALQLLQFSTGIPRTAIASGIAAKLGFFRLHQVSGKPAALISISTKPSVEHDGLRAPTSRKRLILNHAELT